MDIETSLGKRTTQLDLNSKEDVGKLKELVRGADVFLQGYRPGGLDEKGFGVADVAQKKAEGSSMSGNGIVYASLRAWGWDGPWAGRRGVSHILPIKKFLFNRSDLSRFSVRFVGSNSDWIQRR